MSLNMELREEKKYLLWLNQHSRLLHKFAGRWVGIKLGKGVVSSGKSLKKIREEFLKHYPNEMPHLLQVPQRGQRFYVLMPSLLFKRVERSPKPLG